MRVASLSLAVALSLSPFAASADGLFNFSSTFVSGPVGGTTNSMAVTLRGDGYSNIIGGEIEYRFDRTKFVAVVSSQNGGICTVRNDPVANIGAIQIVYYDAWASPMSSTPRNLCTIRFDVAPGTPKGYHHLSIVPGYPMCFDWNANAAPCTATSPLNRIYVY